MGMNATVLGEGNAVNVTITVIVALSVAEQPGISYDKLYKEADAALYEAKKRGKGCFYIYGD